MFHDLTMQFHDECQAKLFPDTLKPFVDGLLKAAGDGLLLAESNGDVEVLLSPSDMDRSPLARGVSALSMRSPKRHHAVITRPSSSNVDEGDHGDVSWHELSPELGIPVRRQVLVFLLLCIRALPLSDDQRSTATIIIGTLEARHPTVYAIFRVLESIVAGRGE